NGEARASPCTQRTGYGRGRAGWVSATFARGDKPPVDLLEEWIEESYRAVAPKKLVKLLDIPYSNLRHCPAYIAGQCRMFVIRGAPRTPSRCPCHRRHTCSRRRCRRRGD